MAFELVVNDNLGLMIRGGIEYGLGIYITGVDEESAAFRNGLRVRFSIILKFMYSEKATKFCKIFTLL